MTKREILSITGVLAVFLCIGTVADLNISRTLYNPGTWFPTFFAVAGEIPGTIIGAFCCALMLVTGADRAAGRSIRHDIFWAVVMLVLCGLSAIMLRRNFASEGGLAVAIAALAFMAVLLLLASKADKDQRTAIRRIAMIGILTLILANASVNLVKVIWGRPRFRSMQEDFTAFVAWYRPQSIALLNDEFKSFPSGHSANAAIVIWITLLPQAFARLKGWEWLLKAVAYGWTLCVMLSRIVAGAHFLSDVTMGAACTFLIFLILCRRERVL